MESWQETSNLMFFRCWSKSHAHNDHHRLSTNIQTLGEIYILSIIYIHLKIDQLHYFFKKLIGAQSRSALTSIPLSSLSGPRLKCGTKSGGVQCGEEKWFQGWPTPYTPHHPTTQPQLRACIESLGLQFIWIASAEAEWSVVGPWLGWGGVKCEARSAECPPPPDGPRVRVCVLEQGWEKCNSTKPAGTKNMWFGFCLCKCVILWYYSMFCCVYKYLGCVCVLEDVGRVC